MTKENSAYETYIDHLHQSAAGGNISGLADALKVLPDVDATNSKGWTALMFAARNGHKEAVSLLVEKGCDTSKINSVGQTAADIAEFWQHHEVVKILSNLETGITLPTYQRSSSRSNHFCDNPLYRSSEHRKDETWLNNLMTEPTTVYVLLSELTPLVKPGKFQPQFHIVRFDHIAVKHILENNPTIVFLGVERSGQDDSGSATDKKVGWFAVDVGPLQEDQVKGLQVDAIKLPFPFGFMQLSRAEAAIAGQARSMLAWHERYRFCPTCGGSTISDEAGYKRVCQKPDCLSNKGVHNTCYPRTDPTVIMAVVSQDGSQLLLARGKRFNTTRMWSCLAGFMEPGESIEEACRREVYEETNIHVGRVDYHSSQPWPMPSSLMIGCIAYAQSKVIKVDKTELEDAKWFDIQDVRLMLTRQHPNDYTCPPEQAIAHHLIKHWLTNISKL